MIEDIKTLTHLTYRFLLRVLLGREKRDEIIKKEQSVFLLTNILSKYKMKWLLKYLGHEKQVREAIEKINGEVFIDIGANVGFYSILFSKNFRKVYAIEPETHNYTHLIRNTRDIKNIKCIKIAISDFNGELPFYLTEYCGSHSLLKTNEAIKEIKVKSMTLEKFFNVEGIKCADLIKVDVEGAEFEVLKGALKVMNKIKRWVIELHDRNRKLELENLLRKYGYDTMWINGRRNHLIARRD